MGTKTIGVIGLGSIGSRHAYNLMDLGHTVHGYDPIKSTGQPPMIIRHGTVEGLIKTVDAVVIASPTSMHLDHIMSSKFKTPLFVEKPIAHKVDADLALLGQIMVGYNLRFHGCVKRAKEWIRGGQIGVPLWAQFTCAQYNDKPSYLRDGVILNWSHEIDLALYLLGPAEVAASSTRLTDGKDDITNILLTHDNGCRSSVHLDYVTKQEQRDFLVAGTKGVITVNLVQRMCWLLDREQVMCVDSFDENYIEEMQAFIDRIDGKETIGATGAEGLAVLDICLDVRKQAGL